MGEGVLKVCEYNVENLFISMDYYDGQDLRSISENEWKTLALAQLQRKQKPLSKLWGVAKAVLDINPDVLMLAEVGGQDSLENFNRYFLNDQYVPYFVAGNSRRSIDLGFLVKKDLPFRVEAVSNKETPIEVQAYQGKYTAKFSRDVAELRLHDEQGLQFILLLVHLKSKISSDQDFRGTDVRTAEAHALAEFYARARGNFPEVPIILGGDFNAPLGSSEFDLLNESDLADLHELLGTPEDARYSLIFFDYYKTAHAEALDYLLLSPHLHDRVVPERSGTYRYKGFYDIPHDPPKDRNERYLMPSDHYPVYVSVSLNAKEPFLQVGPAF
ncbi:MAG: endonuclease/exonuclease/phosphatase family protein [Bdellovibrionales bacterium]|nr:endonuclease/exonuclease/phosphatase family protein [Oligoflexia bacterium]